MNRIHSAIVALLLVIYLTPNNAQAQTTEERFQDLFVTAGYATAFGAALGAAMLSFVPDPASELRYVAYGASLGFIGGSVMGTYIIFSPMLSMENHPSETSHYALQWHQDSARSPQSLAYNSPRSGQPGLVVRPVFTSKTGQLESLTGAWTLATF